MKKKNLKNFIGQIFILKRDTSLISLLQDDYVDVHANTCLMLLDIVSISVLESSLPEDGYYSWDIREKRKERKAKHMASFLHGQQIVYYPLEYQTSIKDFCYVFKSASGSGKVLSGPPAPVKRKLNRLSTRPFSALAKKRRNCGGKKLTK